MTNAHKIIVIEDDISMMRSIIKIVKQCGHIPVCAIDSRDALHLIFSTKAKLIITDIELNELSGLDLMSLKNHSECINFETPVICCSVSHDFEDVETAFQLGAEDYMVKPVHLKQLKHTLKKID